MGAQGGRKEDSWGPSGLKRAQRAVHERGCRRGAFVGCAPLHQHHWEQGHMQTRRRRHFIPCTATSLGAHKPSEARLSTMTKLASARRPPHACLAAPTTAPRHGDARLHTHGRIPHRC